MTPVIEKTLQRIVERLKEIAPYKVVLFGSYAWSTPTADSDIDLVVVLNNENVPTTHDEVLQNYLHVKRKLRDINEDVSMDVMVCTKTEWGKFIREESSFSKKIEKEGRVLYESRN